MRFPISEINLDTYYSKLKELIISENCHVFLDTNIISQIYRLNSSARTELYGWLDQLNNVHRVHVPNWAIHEYSNRYLSKRTSDYVSELDELSKTPKRLNNILNFLKMYVDENVIHRESPYANDKERLFIDFEKVISNMELFVKAFDKKKIQKTSKDIHQEIVRKLESFSLDVNVYKLIEDIGFYQDFRYDSKLPPGFKDVSKKINSAGDLVLWQEILSFCENKNPKIGQAILVTRDMKSDFVYCPSEIIEAGNKKANNKEIKVADERLVYEFKIRTSSDDFYIINFEQLVRILSSVRPSSYRKLAIAVQVNHDAEEVLIVDDSNTEEASESLNESRLNSPVSPQSVIDQSEGINANDDNIQYMSSALADNTFHLIEENELHEIIKQLKSYNWDTQNRAIVDFTRIIHNSTGQDLDINTLFVLGRNIYQAACGNSFRAISFIQNIKNELSRLNDLHKKALLDGCLYEIYFDGSNDYRSYCCKGEYIVPLFDCLIEDEYHSSLTFITSCLEPLRTNPVVFFPLHSEPVSVELRGESLDGNNVFSINQILINGQLIDGNSLPIRSFPMMEICDFKKSISKVFAIKEDCVQLAIEAPDDCFVYVNRCLVSN